MVRRLLDVKGILAVLLVAALLVASVIGYNQRVEAYSEKPSSNLKIERSVKDQEIDKSIQDLNLLEDARAELEQLSDKFSIQIEERKVSQITTDATSGYWVYYPVRGAESGSSYTLYFDEQKKLIYDQLLIGQKNVEGNIDSKVYKNGKLIVEASIKPDGSVISGYVVNENGEKQMVEAGDQALRSSYQLIKRGIIDSQPAVGTEGFSDWLSCMNDCLASMGVASWLLGTLGIVCGIACGVTLMTGCYPCMATLFAGYALELQTCWSRCLASF